jgi:WXG100 family type VII secretion target
MKEDMAANKIRVNTGSLDQTRKELQAKLDKVRKDIDHISDDMGTLNSMWEGDAHQAYVQSITDDMQVLSEVCEGIQSMIRYESNAVTEYGKCEQQVADVIAKISI